MRSCRSFTRFVVSLLCMIQTRCLSFVLPRTYTASFLLRRSMAMNDASAMTTDHFHSFLLQQKQSPNRHIVIGNEAGDADSIISAISWAYVKSHRESVAVTPVLSITRTDLETQRPETRLLLRLAEISTESLVYVDDPLLSQSSQSLDVTLVDHNQLTFPLSNARVVEILDHHADLQSHLDAPTRIIAYENQAATVASTCTLVAEHLVPPVPASLSVLLLGVILLDSVNMLPAAGKGTERDQRAINTLLQSTNWKELSVHAQKTLRLDENHGVPDTTALFQALQEAKFDPAFWNELSVLDALRLDYKRFQTSNTATFGSSSVLISLDDFCRKPDLQDSIKAFMEDRDLKWLFILFSYVDNGTPKRQIMVYTTTEDLNMIAEYMSKHELLQLTPRQDVLSIASPGRCRSFDQGNVKASRKQVAPILMDYFDTLK